ncbi:MAG: SDR family NAD(P)-dependent oxidoreductase [Armatimonadota bacterium]|nr:SDR family NAD(P)-dependent oxidoreductase [Armatimonadota bacterium]
MGALAGQVGVVVGAGRGLGRTAATALAHEGMAVVATARTAAEVYAAVDDVTRTGGQARAVVGDASIEADAERMIAAALDWRGRLDVLLVCAGAALIKPLLEVSLAEWEHLFAMNTRSVFLTNRAALRPMLAAGAGLIINVSSRAGITGAPNIAGYTAAKAAVLGFSRALALEVKPRGVRVACLAPAPMDTPMRWAATPDFEPQRLISTDAVVDLVLYLARRPDVTLEDPAVPMSVRL